MASSTVAPSVRPTRTAPLAVAAAAAGALAVVGTADPATSSGYPPCPFHALTGWWCPLCGSLRGVHDLLAGDVSEALGSNLLLVVTVPLLAAAWLAWAVPATRPGLRPLATPRALVTLAVLAMVYTVLRNLPWPPVAGLAP